MSELKCPICNDGKIITYLDGTYECDNHECSIYNGTHTETFEALIRTRKALKMALKELKKLKYGGKADRTYLKNKAGKALEQIKELDNAETHI